MRICANYQVLVFADFFMAFVVVMAFKMMTLSMLHALYMI